MVLEERLRRDLSWETSEIEPDVAGVLRRATAGAHRRRSRRNVALLVASVAGALALAVALPGGVARVRDAARPATGGVPAPPGTTPAPGHQWYRMAAASGGGPGGTWHFSAGHNASGTRMCSVFVAPSGDRTRSCFGTPSASAAATGLFGVATARDASGAVIFGEVGNAATRVVLDRAHGRAIDARVIRGMPVFQFFVIVVPGRGSGTLQAVDTSGHALRVRRVAWS